MPERHRNLMWPVLLIVAGVVLLLVQFGVISLAWGELWRLWPVLLILIGLNALLGGVRNGGIIFLVLAAVIIVATAIWVLPGMQRAGQGAAEMNTANLAYPVAGIESATVRLEVSAGQVRLATMSDSSNLLEADITYDERRSTLEEGMDTQNDEATVRIRTDREGGTFGPFWGVESSDTEHWDVRLNADVPASVELNAGASDTEMDLSDATLTALSISAGVGSVRVSLPARGSYSVDVNGGVGSLTLDLPDDVEARIRVDGGLGSVDVDSRFEKNGNDYVTAGYDDATERVEIDIDGGVGSIRVR